MTEQSQIVERPEDASQGAFNSILEVEGIPRPFKLHEAEQANQWGKYTTRIEIGLDDAIILKMREGEDEPELKDDIFKTFMNYAPKGKKPHKNSTYIRGFVQSLADAKTTWSKLVEAGDRIVLKWRDDIPLGFKSDKKDEAGNVVFDEETGEPVRETAVGACFVYVSDGSVEQAPIEEHVKNLVLGKNESAAKRSLMMDSRAKKAPEFKEALNNGELAKMLDIVQDEDGVFTENQ